MRVLINYLMINTTTASEKIIINYLMIITTKASENMPNGPECTSILTTHFTYVVHIYNINEFMYWRLKDDDKSDY